MISVWEWVGIVIGSYGLIIFGSGIYYVFNQPSTHLSHINAPLWWGGIMIIFSIIITIFGRNERKKEGR